MCTHGGDDALATTETGTRHAPASRAQTPPAPCAGNGRTGRRIHVLLGYPSDTPMPDATTARPLIKQVIAMADKNLDAQSSERGQHYRFWCKRDRSVTISKVALAPIGVDVTYAFDDVMSSLAAAGFDRAQFVYSVFVANIDCCYAYGGQGSLAVDDRPNPTSNANNGAFARYSMIRFNAAFSASGLARVWQHETGHNLGAVQNSAPHASGGFHCYEEFDVMCYDDGGSYFAGGGGLVDNCPSQSADGQYAFDCNGDDYYNVDPANGNYLTDHWNLADSRWLTPVGKTVH
jgi:hypothetical protein